MAVGKTNIGGGGWLKSYKRRVKASVPVKGVLGYVSVQNMGSNLPDLSRNPAIFALQSDRIVFNNYRLGATPFRDGILVAGYYNSSSSDANNNKLRLTFYRFQKNATGRYDKVESTIWVSHSGLANLSSSSINLRVFALSDSELAVIVGHGYQTDTQSSRMFKVLVSDSGVLSSPTSIGIGSFTSSGSYSEVVQTDDSTFAVVGAYYTGASYQRFNRSTFAPIGSVIQLNIPPLTWRGG